MSVNRNISAGIVLFRTAGRGLEVLLAHPGGPYWARRDAGVWTIVKGEIEANEDPERAALREFGEETGFALAGKLQPLGAIRQAGGKVVHGFAVRGDFDPAALSSSHFEMEWPPRSGQLRSFPEIDRVEWFDEVTAKMKINPAQIPFIDQLSSLKPE